jgi:hypothetical protein
VPVPFTLKISDTDEKKALIINEETILDWSALPEGTIATIDTKTGLVKNEKDGKILNKYVSGNLTYKIPVKSAIEGAKFTCLYI